MRNGQPSLFCPGLFRPALASASADPLLELSSFSIFDKVDLAQLAKSDAKTAHGPPMSIRGSFPCKGVYVMPGSAHAAFGGNAQLESGPEHHEPKVYLHGDLPGSPSEAAFAKLKSAPDNGPVRALANGDGQTGK